MPVNPPDYPPSRLRPLTCVHYFSLGPTTYTALLLSYTTPPSGEYRRNSETHLCGCSKTGCRGNVPKGTEKLTADRSSTDHTL